MRGCRSGERISFQFFGADFSSAATLLSAVLFWRKKKENIKENPVHQIWVSVGPAGPQTDRQTGPNPHRVLPFCLLSAAANKAKENWLSTSNELDKWQLRGRRLSLSFPFKYQLDAIKSISAAQITAKRAPNCNKQFTHQTRT